MSEYKNQALRFVVIHFDLSLLAPHSSRGVRFGRKFLYLLIQSALANAYQGAKGALTPIPTMASESIVRLGVGQSGP